MRVIFDVIRDGMASINNASRELARAQQQLSSGRRVSSAGDDPLAVQLAIGERATLGAIDAYGRATSSAAARLSAVDNVLSGLGDKLTAAKVAAQAARGTNISAASRAASSAEVRSLRDAILSDINTSSNGTFVFGGTVTDRQPFVGTAGAWTYQGNNSVARVEVEKGRLVSTTFDGRAILQGADSTNVLNELDTLATAIDAGDNVAIGVGMDAIDRAFGRTQRAIGTLGADERAVDDAALRLSSLRAATDVRRSSLEDVNMAEAVTRMTQAETAYRAALTAVSTAERQSLLDYLR